MRTSIRVGVGLALLLLIGLLGALQTAWGQEVTAAIVGSVEDPSGAPIKGAAVVARDTDHGVLYTAQTNDSGAFNLQHLPIGTYDVKVTAPGFDTAVHAPFTLVLNQTARLDLPDEDWQGVRDYGSERLCPGPADGKCPG